MILHNCICRQYAISSSVLKLETQKVLSSSEQQNYQVQQ